MINKIYCIHVILVILELVFLMEEKMVAYFILEIIRLFNDLINIHYEVYLIYFTKEIVFIICIINRFNNMFKFLIE